MSKPSLFLHGDISSLLQAFINFRGKMIFVCLAAELPGYSKLKSGLSSACAYNYIVKG